MQEAPIEIFQSDDGEASVEVRFDTDTVWLTQQQMADLFGHTKQNISLHINNCYNEDELKRDSTVKESLTVRKEGIREVARNIIYYNLDVIISVGYRVKSRRGVQFRQWATSRLKDILVKGYAIDQKRLEKDRQNLELLKSGIKILGRAIEEKASQPGLEWLTQYAKGLELLDDYDHEELDTKGETYRSALYPTMDEYVTLIDEMRGEFASDVFGVAKDNNFEGSVKQIEQVFGGEELYPTLEEKAATLLYLITKNHSFTDGNKRIAAACFLLFLQKNGLLHNSEGKLIISNEALASLTLFIAESKAEEVETVKRLVVSVLNRGS